MGKKVNKQAGHVWDVFGSGSDIVGNYPVLLGIADFDDAVTLPKTMAKVEVRLTDPVKIKGLSHVKVPADKVDEVQRLLQNNGYNTSVFPIELSEYSALQHTFTELLDL